MVTIRKCHPGDQKAIQDLIVRIMNHEFQKERLSFPIEDLDDVCSSYGKLGEAFFVAQEDGRIVGTIGVKQEDERTALMRRLFVDSTYRRKGIGGQLIERAVEFCREVGYDELTFKTTSTMDHAVRMCEKKGFVAKAKLGVGPIYLLKFALFLKEEPILSRGKKAAS
ncbi:MAG: GNAT family N-acetyltransferase [Candidatus Omnitrophica bacterium]|nr:GNAT family N-acetyltransferase [Candidatus Omnitrophota bacterium]